MNRWQEQFDSHPIHKTIEELNELASTEFDDFVEEEIPERRRFIKVLTSLENTIRSLDPEITPINILNSLHNDLNENGTKQEVLNYKSTGQLTHIQSANNNITKIIDQLSIINGLVQPSIKVNPLKKIEKEVDEFSETLIIRKNSIEDDYDSINDELSKQRDAIKNLTATIESRKLETDGQLTQWQQQFSESQDRRSSEYGELKNRIEDHLLQWRETYNDDQNTRDKDFDQLIEDVKKVISEKEEQLINDSKGVLSTNQIKYESELKNILSDSEKKHSSILELYQLSAEDSVAGGYSKTATDEAKTANTWRKASIGFILATAIWLLIPVFSDITVSDNGNILWSKVALAFSLTGVLLFGSAYSAQQSTKHRNNEKRTRWFALEVKALDPFISTLSPTDQNELKKKLSEKLFGQTDNGTSDGTKVIDEHAFNVVVKGIMDILGKVPKD